MKKIIWLLISVSLGLVFFQNCSPLNSSTSSMPVTEISNTDLSSTSPVGNLPSSSLIANNSSAYHPNEGPVVSGQQVVRVSDSNQLKLALSNVKAGDEITLEDGEYHLDTYFTKVGGSASKPIFVRSKNDKKAKIFLCSANGFFIDKPFWIFENLTVEGECPDTMNDHAFHIVGLADHTIIRSNHVINFLSHVKVNGQNLTGSDWSYLAPGNKDSYAWPDDVWIIKNTWRYTRPLAHSPRVPQNAINVDGGDRMWIYKNAFVDLVSANPSQSAASNIYLKMGTKDFVVEQNLVVCQKYLTDAAIGFGGDRRGISTGDSGVLSEAGYCEARPGRQFVSPVNNQVLGDCNNMNGFFKNNIVLNCNGSGGNTNSFVFGYDDSKYVHNTAIGGKNFYFDKPSYTSTTGQSIVGNSKRIDLFSNIFERQITFQGSDRPLNEKDSLYQGENGSSQIWTHAKAADFSFKDKTLLSQKVTKRSDTEFDFCGNKRSEQTEVGAIDYSSPELDSCLRSIKQWYDSL